MHGYAGIFVFAGFVRTAVLVLRVLSTWSQSVRDMEFLVEMRLRNLEPEKMVMQNGSQLATRAELEDDVSDNVM
jgi:E3 ubiquitin-protein ligase MARCH6